MSLMTGDSICDLRNRERERENRRMEADFSFSLCAFLWIVL